MPHRLLRDRILRDELLNDLDGFTEATYFRLLVAVDDYGNIDARPYYLRSMLYPLKRVEESAVEAACAKLCEVGLATLYQVDGYDYLHFEKFEEEQKLKYRTERVPRFREEKGDYRGMRWEEMTGRY